MTTCHFKCYIVRKLRIILDEISNTRTLQTLLSKSTLFTDNHSLQNTEIEEVQNRVL